MLIHIKTLADNPRGPRYMEAVLAGLHQANMKRLPLTLEFGTREQTVGLFCRVPAGLKAVFTEHIQDAYPGCSVDVLPDDALERSDEMRIRLVALRLTPDVFSLRTHESFEDLLERELVDPVAGLLSAIRTGRRGRLQCRIRLTIRPARRSRTRHARRVIEVLARRFPLQILHNWFADFCTSDRFHERWLAFLLRLLSRPVGAPAEEDLRKINEHLFEALLLVSVAAPPGAEVKAREKLRELVGSFGHFTSQRAAFTFRHVRRLPSRVVSRRGFLLSPAELATLWHPTTQAATVARLGAETFQGLEPPTIHTTIEERTTLLKYGKVIGRAIEELISIVSPATFYNWVRNEKNHKPKPKNPKGGQRKPKELRELVLTIAEETGFGLTRIVGEMRKLGIKISRQTVRRILKEHGVNPSPDRTSDSWADFLKRHGETLWGCDFFSVKSVTAKGIRDLYVMVFLCLKTREVVVTESTLHPDSAWVCRQTEWFVEQTKDREKKPEMILHDRDVKFTKEFTKTVKDAAMKTSPLPIGSPNLNGRCERFIETIKLECLSRFIVFGKRHLDYLISHFTDYYNHHRSHMERDYLPPVRSGKPEEVETLKLNEVVVKSHVGGLVKSFQRKAA